MKHLLILFGLLFFSVHQLFSQSLPANTCGVVYKYDAAGNRTQRAYVCNNGTATTMSKVDANAIKDMSDVDNAIQVNTLYPNPTTGRFTVVFTKALSVARVELYNANGGIVQRKLVSGTRLDMDISGLAQGVYYLQISDNTTSVTQKVIKITN